MNVNSGDTREDVLLRELLAPLGRVRPVSRRRRRLRRGTSTRAALVGLAVALASVAGFGLWSTSQTPLTEQALAAIGTGPLLRIVLEERVPYAAVVDLESQEERVVVRRLEVVYDERGGRMRFLTYVDGTRAGAVSGSPSPTLRRFVSGFREALEDGSPRLIGQGEVFGQQVDLISIATDDGRAEEVALHADSHEPVAVRFSARDGWSRVISIESSSADFEPLPNTDSQVVLGDAKPLAKVRPSEVSSALGAEALWAGRSIAGLTLMGIQLESLTTTVTPNGESRAGLGVTFRYGSGEEWIDISESTSWHSAYGFYGPTTGADAPLAAEGSMRLACDACDGDHAPEYRPMWTGHLRMRDMYIRLRSPSRSVVIEAARALTPVRVP